MRNFYRLSSSMDDRVNFDDFAWEMGYEYGRSNPCVVGDNTELAELAWCQEVSADNIGYAESDDDARMFPVAVDDLDEAKARWLDAWKAGFDCGSVVKKVVGKVVKDV